MIILNKITDSIDVKLSGAVTTNQLDCVVSFDDKFHSGTDESRQLSTTNDTTYVSICVAADVNITRNIDFISIFNKDTVAATVEVCYNDNGTRYCILKQALNAGETLQYNEQSGWTIF